MENLKFIFDADGVVCIGGSFAPHLQREHGIQSERLAHFFTETFPHCISGQKDLLAEIAPLLPGVGWCESPEDFLKFWFTREHVVDGRLLAGVAQLRRSGVACHLGTNQEKYRIAYMRERMGLARHFERVFASCELGAAKPGRAFFSQVTDALACRPEEIVLIDDSERNVAAAAAFGWRAVHYRSFADFEGFLRGQSQGAKS